MDSRKDSAAELPLEQLFGQMRREEMAQAPAFPDGATLSQRAPSPAARPSYRATPKVAAAIALLAALALLLSREPTPQDPAQLYADIMNTNRLATDTLLSVSPGTLPGMADLPDVYDFEAMSGELERIN
tara:strand:- start:854 stop:1240 length:387 start_codon:yes stop_codon:yes gene_type:complete